MNRRWPARFRAVAGRLERAAAAVVAVAALALITGSSLCRVSPRSAVPRRSPTRLGVAPVPGENAGAAGRACLKASVLLSRRARRSDDRGEEHILLAMSHVLDALHRGGTDSSSPVPGALLSTLTRLVDQLERLEREPCRATSTPGPDLGSRPPAERNPRS